MSEPLPQFRYHPDPLKTGALKPSENSCVVCGKARGYVNAYSPYTSLGFYEEQICPWCIADGSAAAKLQASFTGEIDRDIPDAACDEINHRTPGYIAWQDERWLGCCDDGAAYLGIVGYREIVRYPQAMEDICQEGRFWKWSEEYIEEYLQALQIDGPPSAYLFRCLHCQRYLAYSDST